MTAPTTEGMIRRPSFQHIRDAFGERMVAAVKADIAWQKAHRHERLRAAIREVTHYPAMFERHRYFRQLGAGIALSPDEAIAELSRLKRNQQSRIRGRHWSSPEAAMLLPTTVEALTFARFLRRFGARLHTIQARAA